MLVEFGLRKMVGDQGKRGEVANWGKAYIFSLGVAL